MSNREPKSQVRFMRYSRAKRTGQLCFGAGPTNRCCRSRGTRRQMNLRKAKWLKGRILDEELMKRAKPKETR